MGVLKFRGKGVAWSGAPGGVPCRHPTRHPAVRRRRARRRTAAARTARGAARSVGGSGATLHTEEHVMPRGVPSRSSAVITATPVGKLLIIVRKSPDTAAGAGTVRTVERVIGNRLSSPRRPVRGRRRGRGRSGRG